jgi:hypothetical protein
MYSPVWLWSRCSHQRSTTNSGRTTVTTVSPRPVCRRISATSGIPMSRKGSSTSERGTGSRCSPQASTTGSMSPGSVEKNIASTLTAPSVSA